MKIGELQDLMLGAMRETERVIIGQKRTIELSLVTIFTGNHALIEGVPGVAKTLLVRTLGKVLGSESHRIQFTPDLMPSDITGTNVFNLKQNEFLLVKGPVFTTFLLADEINRAPAKTQSALLQAMQERLVSIDRETYKLSPHFTVFATQNPIEFEGTYPLPEAQKDRFMVKIPMTVPDREEELGLVSRMLEGNSPESVLELGNIQALANSETLEAAKRAINDVTVKDEIAGYIVDVVRKTRNHPAILSGAGPRATQAFLNVSRGCAVLAGRDFVTPDDIKGAAVPILVHRILLRPEFEIEGLTAEEVITQILQEVPVPR